MGIQVHTHMIPSGPAPDVEERETRRNAVPDDRALILYVLIHTIL